MSGILGRKVGMTSVFDDGGRSVVCTVIEAGPCAVTQVKTEETDGYSAVQLAFGDKKAKRTTKALKGHFEKAGVEQRRSLIEFRDFDTEEEIETEVNEAATDDGDLDEEDDDEMEYQAAD